MEKFGPLASIVAYAGYLTAAALAIRVAWAGKLLWEPDIRDLAKAPARAAGVVAAVVIVLLFALSRTPGDWRWLIPYALTFAALGTVALLGYIVLLAGYTVQCPGDTERTVAGFWLTPTARKIMSGDSTHLLPGQTPPASIRELYCGSAKDADRIWPPVAQGLAKAAVVAVYMAFIAPATLSIATGAIILEKTARTASTSLDDATRQWVGDAEAAKKAGTVGASSALPIQLQNSRARFEAAWAMSGLAEREAINPGLLWQALSAVIRTYRLSEYDSRYKNSSLYWADQAITHYDQIQGRQYLVESLLDKAAIYLELTQLDHTDAVEFQRITNDGDNVMSRAAGLSDQKQKPTVMRLWSRFYYNLARPRSNKLSENWSNTYLMLAVQKAAEAYRLGPSDLPNATQLSRATQKVAGNPPQDTDPEWTKELRRVQQIQVKSWNEHSNTVGGTTDKIPPLDILGVMTSELVLREFLESQDRGTAASRLLNEMNEIALPPLREAYALVRNTELRGRYSFDLAYDLARAHAVVCQLYQETDPPKATGACKEATDLMKEARSTATATQLDAALESLDRHPTLAHLSSQCRQALRVVLSSG